MSGKATMTLNMPQAEMDALSALAVETGMTKTLIMRQAFKLYQMAHIRQANGERMVWSGDLPMLAPAATPTTGARDAD